MSLPTRIPKEKAFSFLGSAKFYTPQEALDVARMLFNEFQEKYRLTDELLEKSHILNYLRTAPLSDVKKFLMPDYPENLRAVVIERSDYPIEEAHLLAEEYPSYDYWIGLLKREDVREMILDIFSKKEALEYAKKYKHWRVWNLVLSHPDMTSQEVITTLRSVNHNLLWENMLFQKIIPIEKAIKLARDYTDKSPSHRILPQPHVWSKLVLRDDLRPKKALELAKKINLTEVYEIIYSRDDVRGYLES